MGSRHVALLVEDEPEMAEEIKELLQSFGHDCIHAATQAAAMKSVERGDFCYVLLDLQIKIDDGSIKAWVEAGEHLLELIRGRYPRRGNKEMHLLPVIVMSGHAKETRYVIRAMQKGADDFVNKPLSENTPSLEDKIRTALDRSGRDDHQHCPAVTLSALDSGPDAQSCSEAKISLVISGRQQGAKVEVLVDGRSVLLTASSFLMLMRLARARFGSKEGWVHKRDLGCTYEQGWKGVSRLVGELKPFLPGVDFTENDRSGSYRIDPSIRIERMEFSALQENSDARVKEIAREMRELEPRAQLSVVGGTQR